MTRPSALLRARLSAAVLFAAGTLLWLLLLGCGRPRLAVLRDGTAREVRLRYRHGLAEVRDRAGEPVPAYLIDYLLNPSR